MTLSGKKHALYRFESNGEEEYFDANGQSARSMLMKTPVDGARISSRFGRRFHPVLGYNRMHKGIDFAVPTGTPVMAAGSGAVTFAGYTRGFGNLVVVSHTQWLFHRLWPSVALRVGRQEGRARPPGPARRL